MSRRVAISSNAAQNLDIQNLRDKTQGLDYKKDTVSLTGPQGGKLASKTTALTWDAQGNVVIPTKLQLGNADLQTTLDGKQPTGDYLLKPEFTAFQTKVSNDFKGYVQKPELATFQTKVANDLKSYVVKPEFASYQQKVTDDLKGYVQKPELATFQTKVANDLKSYALVSDVTKINDSLKGYALAGDVTKIGDSLKGYALAGDVTKINESLKGYAQVKQLEDLRAQIPKSMDLSQYAQVKQLDELRNQIPKPLDLNNYATVKKLDEYASLKKLDEYASLKKLDEYASLKKLDEYAPLKKLDEYAPLKKLDEYAPLKKLDEYAPLKKFDEYSKQLDALKSSIPQSQDLSQYAKTQDLNKLQSSIDSISKVNLSELSDKVKSLDLKDYPKRDEIPKLVSVPDVSNFVKRDDLKSYPKREETLIQGASGNVLVKGLVNFESDTDGASIGLKDYGANRKDLALIWADDEDDKLRLIHRHWKDGEKEMMFIDRTASTFPQPAYFKGGSSVHNPDNWQTHFPWAGDGKNYIRGDTELRGNLNNIGDINVEGNLTVKGKPLAAAVASVAPSFDNAMNDKQLRLRAVGDGNHYIAYTNNNNVDGARVQGHQGGQLGTNAGGDKTALQWDKDNNVFVNMSTNPLKFSANWTAFPDNIKNGSEISNDTGNFKKLMIVGNKSAGAERRVGVWDRLDVHGNLGVDGSATVSGRNILAEIDELKKRPVGSGGAAFDGAMNDKQLRLRGAGDGNHYIAFSGEVDGARVQGHQGGQLGTNAGGDKTALQWNKDGNVIIHPAGLRVSDPNDWLRIIGSDKNGVALYNGLSVNDNGGVNVGDWGRVPKGVTRSHKFKIGDKWTLSGVGDAHGNDDWLRVFGGDEKGYHGGIAMNKLWVGTPDATIAGRNVLGEIDALKNRPAGGAFDGNIRGQGVVNFGSDQEKEVNAGKIGYGTFDGGANGTLNIVGAGKNGQPRQVQVWESLKTTQAIGVGADMPRDWTGANFKRRDGRWTHFDWVGDQRNYIRGNTVHDGVFSLQDNQLRLRDNGDGNHYLGFSGAVDGPRLQGHQGGQLGTNAGGDKTALTWNRTGVYIPGNGGDWKAQNNQLCVGKRWCLRAEGANDEYLVFRDMEAARGGVDRRYAMFPDRYVDINRSN